MTNSINGERHSQFENALQYKFLQKDNDKQKHSTHENSADEKHTNSSAQLPSAHKKRGNFLNAFV